MSNNIEGRTIVECRAMTDQEKLHEGWDTTPYETPPVIVLDDRTKLYPSRDAEGNGPGALFGYCPRDGSILIMPQTPSTALPTKNYNGK